MSPWANEFDKILFARTPQIRWIKTGYSLDKDFWKYNFSRLRRKFYELVNRYTSGKIRTQVRGMFLFAPELKRKALLFHAGIYIAHYVPALPAAAAASKKWNTLYAFDAEDFHRGEGAQYGHDWNQTAERPTDFAPRRCRLRLCR